MIDNIIIVNQLDIRSMNSRNLRWKILVSQTKYLEIDRKMDMTIVTSPQQDYLKKVIEGLRFCKKKNCGYYKAYFWICFLIVGTTIHWKSTCKK